MQISFKFRNDFDNYVSAVFKYIFLNENFCSFVQIAFFQMAKSNIS